MLKIFVINLSRRIDRRNMMEAQLSRTNLSWLFVEAIDGGKLTTDQIGKVNNTAVRQLKAGEIGCLLSHQKAWCLASQMSEFDYFWVMEDDVELLDGVELALGTLRSLDQSIAWDILYTNGVSSTDYFFDICDQAHLEPFLNAFCERWPEPSELFSGVWPVGPQIGAYSYILSRSGLQKVQDFFQSVLNPVDVQLGQMNSWLRTYMLLAPLAVHKSDGTSDTSNEH